MYYCIYDKTENNRLHSIELQEPVDIDTDKWAWVTVESYEGNWNTSTLSFDAIPPKPRAIPRKDFIERLTPTEWVSLVTHKTTDPVVAAIFERLYMMDEVYPDSDFTQAMAAHIVAQGYMTQARIDEVLS